MSWEDRVLMNHISIAVAPTDSLKQHWQNDADIDGEKERGADKL